MPTHLNIELMQQLTVDNDKGRNPLGELIGN